MWGFAGWLLWLIVHITFLTGFKNRASALFHWIISFFGRARAERTITLQQLLARRALEASAIQRPKASSERLTASRYAGSRSGRPKRSKKSTSRRESAGCSGHRA